MTNRIPTPSFTESLISKTTEDSGFGPNNQAQGLSEDAVNDLIEKHLSRALQPLWKSQATSMKERAEMKVKIDALENSEQELKNQIENYELNNAQLIDEVEKMRIKNAELEKMLYEKSSRLKKQHKSEKETWKKEKRKMEEKTEALKIQLNLRNELKKIGEIRL